VQGSYDEKYRPYEVFGQSNSFEYQRIFGELHIDGAEVSHTKDNINLGEYEEEFLDKLREVVNCEPKQLIRQARTFKAKTLDDKAIKEISEVTARVTKAFKASDISAQKEIRDVVELEEATRLNQAQELEYPVTPATPKGTSLADTKLNEAIARNEQISFRSGGVVWSVSIVYEKLEGTRLYNLSYRDEGSREPQARQKNVDIIINKDHVFFLEQCSSSKQAMTVLVLLVVTIAVTEMLLTANGNLFARLIHKGFNEQITNVLRGMQPE
jgi:hypothetical protein